MSKLDNKCKTEKADIDIKNMIKKKSKNNNQNSSINQINNDFRNDIKKPSCNIIKLNFSKS